MRNKLLALSLIALMCGGASHAVGAPQKGRVVLLHGLLRSDGSMEEMQDYLEKRGYQVQNIDYPSTEYGLNALADRIAGQLYPGAEQGATPLYMVGHSMGGVLIRLIAARHPAISITAAVELGPPNQGSRLASKLKDNDLYQWVYGPAGQQLATEQFPDIPPVNFPIGIIAGHHSIDPISSTLLEGEDDGKVLLSETLLPEATDHITLPVTHAFMMKDDEVICQTLYFLAHQRFARAGECD